MNSKYETEKVMTLSTGCISKETAAYLGNAFYDPFSELPLTVYHKEGFVGPNKSSFGWFIHVPEDPIQELVKEPEDCPGDLVRLVNLAQHLGFGWINLDPDGYDLPDYAGRYQVSVIGARYAGKTTVAKALAEWLGIPCADNLNASGELGALGLPVVLDHKPIPLPKDIPDIRVFLDADPLERALRRNRAEGITDEPEDALKAVYDPDKESDALSDTAAEATRTIYFDTTGKTVDQVVEAVLKEILAELAELKEADADAAQ